MANKRTRALDDEQYQNIISTLQNGYKAEGGKNMRPNALAATALTLEANLGIRISDILKLKLSDIILENGRYHLNYIVEQKTKKLRCFTVPAEIYTYIQSYCIENGIGKNEIIFPVSERAIQKDLKKACDYLGYIGISTHSFRKFFATRIYNDSGYNIALVQTLLQHSSAAVTQRYIGISSKAVEEALQNHICIVPKTKQA